MKKLTLIIVIIVCILTFITFGNFLIEPFEIKSISLFFFLADLFFIGFLVGILFTKKALDKSEKNLKNANRQIQFFLASSH